MSEAQAPPWEYRSRAALFGLPLVHVCRGRDPATGRLGRARGVIAVGGRAVGLIAVGGVAYGVVAVGGIAVGLVTAGVLGVGVAFCFAGIAVGGIAAGGLAIGGVAFGAGAVGYIAMGGWAEGVYASPGAGISQLPWFIRTMIGLHWG